MQLQLPTLFAQLTYTHTPLLAVLLPRQPLHLSPFTLDDFEQALRHTLADLPCSLLAEIHATLVYNLRTVPFNRHNAILSLLPLKDTLQPVQGVSVEQLEAAMADVGNNWERAPLRHAEGREGWEESLVGCLKDVCD